MRGNARGYGHCDALTALLAKENEAQKSSAMEREWRQKINATLVNLNREELL